MFNWPFSAYLMIAFMSGSIQSIDTLIKRVKNCHAWFDSWIIYARLE